MVYTKSRRYKNGNKTKKHIQTEPNELTVMSFNVELFLNLYDFTVKDDIIESAEIVQSKLKRFKKLFANVDIACLQETYIPGVGVSMSDNTKELRMFDTRLRHLKIQDICRSHILDWENSIYLYGDPSYLANAIYISDRVKTLPKIKTVDNETSHKINKKGLERCYSIATVQVSGQHIKIVSVHLIGGRFDDAEAILDDTYYMEKLNQIKEVVSSASPDIICGDFNTKIRTPEIVVNNDEYFESILAKMHQDTITPTSKTLYKTRWDKWIYMDDIHKYLKESGYKSVYYSGNKNDILDTSITDTSAFGGIVDMIYYKSDSLTMKPHSLSIVGDSVVMKKKLDTRIYTPVLSDHFPVKVSFEII
uniref:Endonuclease/exonuclease/phosphatase domain-containing protein n=1 Tax=viral metagenome TaxID=1070528 RepID=A0A6C0HHC8_9ZZZZ